MEILHFIFLFLGFLLFVCLNNIALNTGVQVFAGVLAFTSLGHIPTSGIVRICFYFEIILVLMKSYKK